MILAALLALSLAPFHASVQTEVRTAYQSRGKIVEDRPIQVLDTRAYFDFEDYGRVGCWYWNYSSWTGRRQHVHRRMFNESDVFAYWEYDWKIAQDWTLCNHFSHLWVGLPGYKPGKEVQNTKEWWYIASLKNPYIVPSLLMRRGWDNDHWIYFQPGLSKPLEICSGLVFTPGVFTEICDPHLYDLRYGDKPDGTSYRAGFVSVIGQLALDWSVSENFSLFMKLQQFGLVDRDAREQAHAPNRRDLTILTVGGRLSF